MTQKKTANSTYYDNVQIQTSKIPGIFTIKFLIIPGKKSLSSFHINACSLNKNFDYLEHQLKCTNKVFVAVSETTITNKTSLTSGIKFKNYSLWTLVTESTIHNPLFCKPRSVINFYKANQLESSFDRLVDSKKSIILVGCLYKHPNMYVLNKIKKF